MAKGKGKKNKDKNYRAFKKEYADLFDPVVGENSVLANKEYSEMNSANLIAQKENSGVAKNLEKHKAGIAAIDKQIASLTKRGVKNAKERDAINDLKTARKQLEIARVDDATFSAEFQKFIDAKRVEEHTACEEKWNSQPRHDGYDATSDENVAAKAAMMSSCKEDLASGKLDPASIRTTKGKSNRRGNRSRLAAEGNLYQLEQAYLLQNIEKFIDDGTAGGNVNAPQPDSLKRIIVARGPGNLINALTVGPTINTLMSLTPAQVSSLSPYIRIFKGTIGGDRTKEFKFSSKSPDISTYLKDGTGAHKNIGLISFDITATGTDPFMAPKSFIANMNISFSSVSDLDISDVPAGELTYLDLLFSGPGQSPQQSGDEDESAFVDTDLDTLFVEIGYKASSNSFSNLAQEDRLAIQDSLDANRKLFILTPDKNEKFGFNEDGTVELLIGFTAAAEYKANNDSSNILEIGEGKAQREKIRGLEKLLKKERARPNPASKTLKRAITKKIARLEKEIKEGNESNKLTNYRSFVKHLVDNDRLFSFSVSDKEYLHDQLPKIFKSTTVSTQEAAQEVIGGKPSSKASNLTLKPPGKDMRTVAYFYLGDLINYMAAALEEGATTNADPGAAPGPMFAEVVMGDYEFEIEEFSTNNELAQSYSEMVNLSISPVVALAESVLLGFKYRRIRINLSQLPVSFDMYNLFMYEQVMKTGRSKYTFAAFLKDAVSKLLSACVSAKVNHRRKKQPAGVQGRGTAGKPPLVKICDGESSVLMGAKGKGAVEVVPGTTPTIKPAIFDTGPPVIKDGVSAQLEDAPRSFIVIYGSMISNNLKGIEFSEDTGATEGVYHMSAGRDRGIVKSVKFEKQEAPDRDYKIIKAYQNQTLDSDLGFRRSFYNATLVHYGAPLFIPGASLYITPPLTGVGSIMVRRSIASQLGLGGFYRVLETSTSLSLGELSTTVKCHWESWPVTESTPAMPIGTAPTPTGDDIISDSTDKNNFDYPPRRS
jgi:hypothetical protein